MRTAVLLLGLLGVCLGSFWAWAQTPATTAAATNPALSPSDGVKEGTIAAPKNIPLPPAPTAASPLDFFRKLLDMTPPQRAEALAKRPEQARQVFEEKIREFEALTPAQREARLQGLQRQLDLRMLVRLPASNRVERLAHVSEADRLWLTARLKDWDQVPADLQRAVLTNMALLRYLLGEPNIHSTNDFRYMTQKQREVMEKAIGEWNQLPEEKRQAISSYWLKIFNLNDKQQAKALEPLTEVERKQMEWCLARFQGLKEGQKARCIAGFQKFAELTPEERQEFLANAAVWEKMNSEERQLWRTMVSRFSSPRPPTPPGFRSPPAPPPVPHPAFNPKPTPLPLVSTNR